MSISQSSLRGSMVALVTPFADGVIQERAFQDQVERQIRAGTTGLIPCGTTGESPALESDEQERLIRMTVEVAAGRVPVIAGAGSNATAHAIQLAHGAMRAGADALLIVSPYYNKPTQEGLYAHFRAIHDATELPIILYNIPGRCVVDIKGETMGRLAELPRIWGVKDATGNLDRVAETTALCGPDFVQLTGEDGSALDFLRRGGHGCISVTANVVPDLCAAMHQAWAGGQIDAAQALYERLAPLSSALFAETSPGPVKYAGSVLGWWQNELRLPLVPVRPETEALVRDALTFARNPQTLAA